MKKLIILLAIVAFASNCFGYTYQQTLFADKQDQVSQTYTITGPSSSWYATYLSYTIDVMVYSGTTPRTTSTTDCWGRINIYDVRNNLLKTDYVTTSALNSGSWNSLNNTYYSQACNTPSIYTAQLILYAEHNGDNTTGGQVWANMHTSSWISVM